MPDLDALIRAELDYEPGTAAAWTRNNALRAVLDVLNDVEPYEYPDPDKVLLAIARELGVSA